MSPDRHDPILLDRDCVAVLIPSGQRAMLRRGDRVTLVQALGGSLTVQTDRGYLARIDPSEADAFGMEVTEVEPIRSRCDKDGKGPFDLEQLIEQVIDQLRTVYDPEIPVNVVDLGLVYACEAQPLGGGGHRIEIKMSMTAPGCGMGDVLREDARTRVHQVPGVTEVDVELVWEPPWDTSRLSEAARLQLGL